MATPKLNIYRRMSQQTITEKMIKAECKKWGISYPMNNEKEMAFIWGRLERMLRGEGNDDIM